MFGLRYFKQFKMTEYRNIFLVLLNFYIINFDASIFISIVFAVSAFYYVYTFINENKMISVHHV